MGGKKWRSGNSERSTHKITRRSILASVGTGATMGLAGCTGDGGGNDGGSGSGPNSAIPGTIVRQDLPKIEVVEHWAEKGDPGKIKIKVQNNREDEPFKRAPDTSVAPLDHVRARVLTEQGNPIGTNTWIGVGTGPGKINPETSGTIEVAAQINENAAKYKICIFKQKHPWHKDWQEVCGGQTPTPTG